MVRLKAKVGKRKETRFLFLSRLKESLEKERNKLPDLPSPMFLILNYQPRKQTMFVAGGSVGDAQEDASEWLIQSAQGHDKP